MFKTSKIFIKRFYKCSKYFREQLQFKQAS